MHELYDLFRNRSEDQRMPAGDAVCGDHHQVDMLVLHHFHNVPGDVISNFDTGGRPHSPGPESCTTLCQMLLRKCSGLLNEFAFGNQVRKCRGGKDRNHIHEMELRVKVLRKVSGHLQSRL